MAATATAPANILFFTNPEYGQANIILATALEVSKSRLYKVHIASFAALRDRVASLNQQQQHHHHHHQQTPPPDAASGPIITFHTLPGLSPNTTARRQLGPTSRWPRSPGFLSAARSYDGVPFLLMGGGDSPEEGYLRTYEACLSILRRLGPAVVVVEVLLIAAHDAVRALGCRYVVMSPCSAKEVVGAAVTPGFPMALKWPMSSSGFVYPLRGWQVLQNLCLFLYFFCSVLLDPAFARIRKARTAAGIQHRSPMFEMYRPEDLYVSPHLPEVDWDELRSTPSKVVACGPIVMPPPPPLSPSPSPSLSSSSQDQELLRWLSRRPTVLVNLGSLHGAEDVAAAAPSSLTLAIAKGLDRVLRAAGGDEELQVLWKLRSSRARDAHDPDMLPLLRDHIEAGRLRITPWLDVEPSALMGTGHVCCSVHHGGANAFYETCRAGIPHLVLPIWWDTYEYAERVRYHRIGAIGNVGSAPTAEPARFAEALLGVLADEGVKRRAAAVGEACRRRGEGREIAAREVLRWAEGKKSWPKNGWGDRTCT